MRPVRWGWSRASRRCHGSLFVAGLLAACTETRAPLPVQYRSSTPLGTWYEGTSAVRSRAPDAGQLAPGMLSSTPDAATAPDDVAGGRADVTMKPGAGAGGMSAQQATGQSLNGVSAAGIGGMTAQAGAGAATAPAVVLDFHVLTVEQHHRMPSGDMHAWGPHNVGAIWIEDASGKFVRSLKVWYGGYGKYLLNYNAARGSTRLKDVDITSTATLPVHLMQDATWDLTDRNGASVAPGPYTLNVEVADYDNPAEALTNNAMLTVQFDTRMPTPNQLSAKPPAGLTANVTWLECAPGPQDVTYYKQIACNVR